MGFAPVQSVLRWIEGRAAHPEAPLPQPERPVCIIGDVHGRFDLLEALLTQLDPLLTRHKARLVFVGDLIDRGNQSARVLTLVQGLTNRNPRDHICLMGNHERMMLDFLTDPVRCGARWLRSGGVETLLSFDVSPFETAVAPEARMLKLAHNLRRALPRGQRTWMETRPQIWREDRLVICHAAIDPRYDLSDQPESALLWADPGRLPARRDDLWVVHGHVVVPEPCAVAGRVAIDTGAYRTGRLSAAWLDQDGLRFFHSTAP